MGRPRGSIGKVGEEGEKVIKSHLKPTSKAEMKPRLNEKKGGGGDQEKKKKYYVRT